eukprot:TRINITY_DN6813_c0_g1_i1.p1 TRINITY_DN6813_c0_g1~~TRINITY_DN6813_c0_g1_i1.p1  ORF type:complete len:209 (-),score=18.18 TRINITY_DN6813_c0_g1_i1:64-690(-)
MSNLPGSSLAPISVHTSGSAAHTSGSMERHSDSLATTSRDPRNSHSEPKRSSFRAITNPMASSDGTPRRHTVQFGSDQKTITLETNVPLGPSHSFNDDDDESIASKGGVGVPTPGALWQPDSSTKVCHGCHMLFTFTNRRHHCRACGFVFCQKCSDKKFQLRDSVYGFGTEPKRVCQDCYTVLYRRELEVANKKTKRHSTGTPQWAQR